MGETLSLNKAPPLAAPSYQKWEYNVRCPAAGQPTITEVSNLGEQGWELCGIYAPNGSTEFIYKRRK